MELSVLALEAVNIALYTLEKTTGGALEKAGADILDFLKGKFQGIVKFEPSEKENLKAAIISEARFNKKFQDELEKLVAYFKQVQDNSQTTESNVTQNADHNSGFVIGQNTNTGGSQQNFR